MKAFYLVISLLLTAVILLFGFENSELQISGLKFLSREINFNTAVIILGIAVIGIITGAFYHAFLSRTIGNPQE